MRGRGYDVAVGKVDDLEVDFVADNGEEKIYIQVAETMRSEEIRSRELKPLQKIRNNYEKIVISLDSGLDAEYEGIKSIRLMDWLLSE